MLAKLRGNLELREHEIRAPTGRPKRAVDGGKTASNTSKTVQSAPKDPCARARGLVYVGFGGTRGNGSRPFQGMKKYKYMQMQMDLACVRACVCPLCVREGLVRTWRLRAEGSCSRSSKLPLQPHDAPRGRKPRSTARMQGGTVKDSRARAHGGTAAFSQDSILILKCGPSL